MRGLGVVWVWGWGERRAENPWEGGRWRRAWAPPAPAGLGPAYPGIAVRGEAGRHSIAANTHDDGDISGVVVDNDDDDDDDDAVDDVDDDGDDNYDHCCC